MGSHIVENPPALRLQRFAGLFFVVHGFTSLAVEFVERVIKFHFFGKKRWNHAAAYPSPERLQECRFRWP